MPKLKRFSPSFHASQTKRHVQKYRQDPDKRQQERERDFLWHQTDLASPGTSRRTCEDSENRCKELDVAHRQALKTLM